MLAVSTRTPFVPPMIEDDIIFITYLACLSSLYHM